MQSKHIGSLYVIWTLLNCYTKKNTMDIANFNACDDAMCLAFKLKLTNDVSTLVL